MYFSHRLIVFGCFCLSNTANALPPPEVFARFGPAVTVLDTYDGQGKRIGAHSATVIAAETLVTVCDVLEMASEMKVSSRSGTFDAKVIARDRERNLCLLSAPGLSESPVPFRPEPVPVGSRAFAISNALALGVGISEGVVSAIREFPLGHYIQFTAPVSPGSEGGALIDEDGRLAGIIDFRRRDGQNVNFASLAGWIEEVKGRAAANAAKLQRFDRAIALSKEEKWTDLKDLSTAWSAEEPDARDPWRFAIAAARGLGDTESELQGWKALYRVDSSSTATGVGLGWALLARDQGQAALTLAQRMSTDHPDDAAAWLLLGRAHHALGQAGDADTAYRRAVQLDPWLIGAYQSLAALAQHRGDTKSAIAIWRRLSGLKPDDPGPRLGLANAYLADGKPARAWQALAQVPDKDLDSAFVWYWKGLTLARLDCHEQAIDAYRKSLERKPERPEWAWAGIGNVLAKQHRYPEAIAAFESASQANPDNDEWRYQLAIALKDGGRSAEALKITTDLVTRNPGESKNWRQHGFTLAVQGRPADAIPAMERSLQLDSRQPKLWAALIESYQIAGRRADAKRAYESLRGIDGQWAELSYRSMILPYEEDLR